MKSNAKNVDSYIVVLGGSFPVSLTVFFQNKKAHRLGCAIVLW